MRKIIPWGMALAFVGLLSATTTSAQQAAGTAQVRHAPILHGSVEGSIQLMIAEDTTLDGGASVTGDLLVPGTPTVRLNGAPNYGGALEGPGAATPSNHIVTLNGAASLGHLVRRTDPVALPTVAVPPLPSGTRRVSLNNSSQSPGDFATLQDLTLNGSVGSLTVPAGTYGDFTANGNNGFILGVAGATTPAVYNFQHLTLAGSGRLEVVGPVIVTLANGAATSGNMGASSNPAWLALNFASGDLTLGGNGTIYGYVTAPSGAVAINGYSQLVGGVVSDQLTVGGNGRLQLIAAGPSFPDNDNDGIDDRWEVAHGLNPQIDDAALDNDKDGVTNIVEFQLGLKPENPDSDGDGLYDGDEIALGRDPAVSSPDAQPPTPPANLASDSMTSDSVTLSWSPASDDLKVSGYVVYRDGQPIKTDQPIRGTTFTDTNLPDGEEFTYQVRSFDFAVNLSPLSDEIRITTIAADTDHDGLPDEWERKYFDEEDASPDTDPDGDGQTNLQELQAGTNPADFYNGTKPTTEALNGGATGPNDELAMMVRRPDGTPWANAPVNFDSSVSGRRIAISPAGPYVSYQLKVRTAPDGVARCYLEPLAP